MKDTNLDFQVYDSRDPNTFIVLDTSYWGIIQDKPSIIEIITPGETYPAIQYYSKNSVNIFNSENLGLSCSDCDKKYNELPDGVYEITIKGSPDSFNKSRAYLRTTKLQLELDKRYIALSLECESDKDVCNQINKLDYINLLLRSSEANVRYGNNCVGNELLQKAIKLLDKLKTCKICV